MAADTLLFVDSIASSPTTRLDLNNQAAPGYWLESFNPSLPRLARALSSNAMKDGGYVSTSTYGMRVLVLTLLVQASSQDAHATLIQNLARELDRTTNILKYQPNGATKPVFFKTFRSDVSGLDLLWTNTAATRVTVEILAEPFALGLRETVSVGTVTNNPAAASRGNYFDVNSVIGDVATPLVITMYGNPGTAYGGVLASSRTQMPTTWYLQAESMTLGTDTTNPGGAADAAMSGSGSTNYRRTSFATATLATRLSTTTIPDVPGSYRLYAMVRKSASSDAIYIQATTDLEDGPTVLVDTGTARQSTYLGTFTFPANKIGETTTTNTPYNALVSLKASRTSGAGTLDWDCIIWVPADEQTLVYEAGSAYHIIDSRNDFVAQYTSGDPLAGTAVAYRENVPAAGSFPYVAPGSNRFYWIPDAASTTGSPLSAAPTVAGYYWPRYLFVRPSAS